MAIVVTSPQTLYGKILNATSLDASGTEILLSGTAGKKIKVKHITLNNLSAGALDFTLSGAAALLGPVSISGNSSLQWDFSPLLFLATNQDLTITAGAGSIMCFLQLFVE